MQQRQVMLRLLIPEDEQAAETVHPRIGPLHDGKACFEAGFPFDRFGLLPMRADVGGGSRLWEIARTPL